MEVSEIEHTLRAAVEPAAGPIIVELLKRKDLGEADVLAAFIYVGGHDPAPESNQITSHKKPSIIAQHPKLLDLFNSVVSKLNSSGSSLPRYMVP